LEVQRNIFDINSNTVQFECETFRSFLNYLQLFIQSSLICMANLVAALIYVYMQFFYTPSFFVIIGHVCWQLSHGIPAFVYLFLNRTIHREVFHMLRIHKRQQSVAPRAITVSKMPGGTEG
uniref:7TM_GPCR_Srx domain-containing protein n=1 Tax=Angiostrongylus cantonensis TaxID=6313 RepID=A0A0K0DRF5_ANGCA